MYFNELDGSENHIAGSKDRITKLKLRIQELLKQSREQAFTDYLKYMQNSIYDAENRVLFLEADLEKQYRIYQENQKKLQPAPQEQPAAAQSAPAPQEQPAAAQPAPAPQEQPAAAQPAPAPQEQPAAAQPAPVAMRPAEQKKKVKDKRNPNVEYAVATAVLGIVGSAFILTAMVLLGMYFLEGYLKGALLFFVSFAVMAMSELLLYKKFPRLGMLFSAIGMAGLYISTLVNYIALGNFKEGVAIAVTTIVTAFVVWLSRKRDALSYRVLGMVAMYGCFFTALWEKQETNELMPVQIVTVGVMMLLIHVMCMAVPIRQNRRAMDIIQLVLNALFSYVVYVELMEPQIIANGEFKHIWQNLVFMGIGVLIAQIIFVMQVRAGAAKRREGAQNGRDPLEENVVVCVAYGAAMLCYCKLIDSVAQYSLWQMSAGQSWQYRLGFVGAVVLLSLPVLIFLAKAQEKWFSWYFLLGSVLIVYLMYPKNEKELVWALTVSLVVSKIFSFSDSILPQISDMILTVIVCIACAILVSTQGMLFTLPLFAAVLFSVLVMHRWQTYYEILLSFTIAWYVAYLMLKMLKLPVFVGILFVGILVFNNVRRWKGEGIIVFNICALCGQAVCYLLLAGPGYHNANLTFLCMLIFGITTIIICFQKTYHLEFAGKYMILPVFLTYMVVIYRNSTAVWDSILLMSIALGCVGAGVYIRKKPLRIYGLVLSLLVCAKLVLYDFSGSNAMMRTIMFFVVGVLALIIASIYIVLEKKQEKKELDGK